MGRAPRPTIINAEHLKGLDDLDTDADDGWAGGPRPPRACSRRVRGAGRVPPLLPGDETPPRFPWAGLGVPGGLTGTWSGVLWLLHASFCSSVLTLALWYILLLTFLKDFFFFITEKLTKQNIVMNS